MATLVIDKKIYPVSNWRIRMDGGDPAGLVGQITIKPGGLAMLSTYRDSQIPAVLVDGNDRIALVVAVGYTEEAYTTLNVMSLRDSEGKSDGT